MSTDQPTMEEMAQRIRIALQSADLATLGDLLDPNVRWGAPDDSAPGCCNREQVLSWYRRGRADGVRAEGTEIVVHANKILVGLTVVGNRAASENGGELDRWQVLTVAAGSIVDIRGFEDRTEAASRIGLGL